MVRNQSSNRSLTNWLPALLSGSLAGLLLGGVIGATVMFLLAPHSGKKNRARLLEQGKRLRHQAAEGIDEAVTDVTDMASAAGDKASEFTDSLQNGAEELQQNVRSMFGKGRN